MSQDQQTYQRATGAAIAGIIVQIALFIGMLFVYFWSESPAIYAAALHFAGGTLIWLMLVVLYHQHRIERDEAMEAERLAKGDPSAAKLFEEHADDLDLSRRRLDHFYKYGLNIISLLTAGYLVGMGGWMLWSALPSLREALNASNVNLELQRMAIGEKPLANPMVLIFATAVPAFIAFVVARWISGMTKIHEWQLLRGGASYLMGTVAVSILLAIAAIFAYYESYLMLATLAVVIPGVMVAIGLEILLTFMLGAYRPRRPGEMPRPAFDSRVLGWFTAPESLGKIITDTINYQFGFEVSRSWFYKLLGQCVVPLLLVSTLVLLALSSVVIVAPYENAVITRWGRIVDVEGPGLTFKAPWPMGRVEKFPVGRIHEISVGTSPTDRRVDTPILWTNQHTAEPETSFLVTAPTESVGSSDNVDADDRAAGMSLVAAEVVVQYLIADLEAYVTSATNPQAYLKAIAEGEVNRYFVSHDIDTLLGEGRNDAGEAIHASLAQAIEDENLGVQLVLVSVMSIHPPQKEESEVAAAFHEQIGALQEKETRIEEARTEATRMLAEVAGSREKALEIDRHVDELVRLKNQRQRLQEGAANAEELDQQIRTKETEVEVLLAEARGKAAERIYDARAYRWQRALSERAKAERFASELAAYREAPFYYRERAYLEALSQTMGDQRKVIVTAGDPSVPDTYRIDLKSSRSALDILGGEQ